MVLMSEDWSDDELRAALEAYVWMLGCQERGEPYSKADARRAALAGPLRGRSAGSFEYRMQNISAVLSEDGLSWIAGYKPASNVGPGPTQRLRELLRSMRRPLSAPVTQTPDAEPPGEPFPQRTTTPSYAFVRDPEVVTWVLAQAAGTCELCGTSAPFKRPGGEPFLEVHHVKPLANGGPDVVTNAVALCPNCHRRCHYSADARAAIDDLYLRVPRLARPG